MSHELFGSRIKTRRDEMGLTQDALAKLLGFDNRQTLSAIETGQRGLSAEELLKAVEVLQAPLDYFTDPFRLVGREGAFSWRRQAGMAPATLDQYQSKAGCWIAFYRNMAPQVGKPLSYVGLNLKLTPKSSFEDAMAAGEQMADRLDLGDIPADRLGERMEQQLGLLVLMVEADRGISGAACHLADLDVVLINRNEGVARRHFDLAHELFHILTWEEMPPDREEDAGDDASSATGGRRGKRTQTERVELLANNFAAALLMPRKVIARFGDWAGLDRVDVAQKIQDVADALKVSAPAVMWRLVALDLLSSADARVIDHATARRTRGGEVPALPPLFSATFMDVVAKAIDRGLISVRRVAGLLDIYIDDIPEICAAHGIDIELGL